MSSPEVAPFIPFLRYQDSTRAVEWLVEAFGFTKLAAYPGPDGKVMHAELRYGSSVMQLGPGMDGAVPMSSPLGLPAVPGGIYVYIGDDPAGVDAHFKQAVAAGATVVYEPRNSADYDARDYTVQDFEKHVWSFGTYRPELP